MALQPRELFTAFSLGAVSFWVSSNVVLPVPLWVEAGLVSAFVFGLLTYIGFLG